MREWEALGKCERAAYMTRAHVETQTTSGTQHRDHHTPIPSEANGIGSKTDQVNQEVILETQAAGDTQVKEFVASTSGQGLLEGVGPDSLMNLPESYRKLVLLYPSKTQRSTVATSGFERTQTRIFPSIAQPPIPYGHAGKGEVVPT